jgi:AbrB family looped-hinge helix DNA binding protein
MNKLDVYGRITLPRSIRERNGMKPDDVFEIYENGEDIILRPMKKPYRIFEDEMDVIRKVYELIKDTDVLEESELVTLSEMCGTSDVKCPNCNKNMYLTNENTYKCINCEE